LKPSFGTLEEKKNKIGVGFSMADRYCDVVVWFQYFVVNFVPYLPFHRRLTGHKMHIPTLVIIQPFVPIKLEI